MSEALNQAEIKTIAVIGSGVMGAAIAAHAANSGAEVLLYDIVPSGASDRTVLAKGAIAQLLKTNPAPLMSPAYVKRITPLNLEDDLAQLHNVDWVIEAVLEDSEIKQNLYRKLVDHCRPDCVISSNTSTIPLAHLINGMDADFASRFMITHFFNPPRYMRLLELVAPEHVDSVLVKRIENYVDKRMGKTVVFCHDTPGFIANRIGCYWMTVAVNEAIAHGMTVEEADAVMGRPFGIPKTGVFGLLDLIGIDLMPLIAKAFSKTLAKDDAFIVHYQEPEVITQMIADGYTGRKGKGGFYRLNKDSGVNVKEAKSLVDGSYAPASKPHMESVALAKQGLRQLMEHGDSGGAYARATMVPLLSYVVSLMSEIADSITAIDTAMKLGYNWKYGPFELIDRLGNEHQAGSDWLREQLQARGDAIPAFLERARGKTFYREEGAHKYRLNSAGEYEAEVVKADAWMLHEKVRGQKPILKNPSAKLWDIGDGIACLEFTSKMNSIDPLILEMIQKTVTLVSKEYKGLVIANDGDNFCVGANIGILLFAANVGAWSDIERIIKQGQVAMMALKYAPFPVVAAPTGMALGGGCELLLHCDAVQAHSEMYSGLVEVGVGIIPGWGGCKEMLLRQLRKRLHADQLTAKLGRMFSFISPIKTLNAMPAISKAFEYIATAKVSKSAMEAKAMLIIAADTEITMNRSRLLCDAKEKCLSLVEGYSVPGSSAVSVPGKSAVTALKMAIASFVKSGKATPHDAVISEKLAQVLSGNDTDMRKEITEQELLDLEIRYFMELVKEPKTLDRLEHMLETGKPLRN